MTGKYNIEIYNNRVHYFLTVQRNITILQGNSGTGKTELIRLLGDYEANGNSSGITVKCDAPCTVLTAVDWKQRLSYLQKHIIFIDETAAFVKTHDFAECVRGSDNYFVIVTRDDLGQLPYSVNEIYGIRNVTGSSKYKPYTRVYNEMYQLYNLTAGRKINPDFVITEDSRSGYQCFDLIFPQKCMAAEGKSRVYDLIRKLADKSIVAIVDGAAFGNEIGRIMRYLSVSAQTCILYAPESFE